MRETGNSFATGVQTELAPKTLTVTRIGVAGTHCNNVPKRTAVGERPTRGFS